MGEVFIRKGGSSLEKEALNCKDGQAVAVMRSRTIVGHVPRNLFSYFLTRWCNKAVVESPERS